MLATLTKRPLCAQSSNTRSFSPHPPAVALVAVNGLISAWECPPFAALARFTSISIFSFASFLSFCSPFFNAQRLSGGAVGKCRGTR